MNALEWLNLSPGWNEFSIRLSLTLLHSIWQGIVMVAIAAVALRCLRRSSANSRYVVAGLALFCFPVAAAITYATLETPTELSRHERQDVPLTSNIHSAIANDKPVRDAAAGVAVTKSNPRESIQELVPEPQTELADSTVSHVSSNNAVAPIKTKTVSVPTRHWLTPLLPWLSAAYLIGVVTMLVRLLLGVWGGVRLRSQSTLATESGLLSVVGQLSTKLGLKLAPAVYFCESIAAPAVIGVLKPAILLPASLLTSLSPTELAAILTHELAHIRRGDLALQFVQKFIETLFFFHPATWWLSDRINDERENCCDDLAASSGFGNVGYATALLKVAELCVSKKRARRARPTGILAADGSNSRQLSRRIERQLNMNSAPRFGSRVSFVLIALIAVGCIASVGAMTLKPVAPVMEALAETSEETDRSSAAINSGIGPVNTGKVADVVWGKSRTGLTAGAKLLSATGKLQPGDPVVVQFLLRNDSAEEQTVVLQQLDSHPVLGADNRVSLNVTANYPNRHQHILKPGAVLENRIYRVSVDTTGWPLGIYQLTARSAFWMSNKDDPNVSTGIPHGKPISFTLGNPEDGQPVSPPEDADPKQRVYWGKPAAGISVGMRLPEGRELWPDDNVTIQGQMFAFNSTGKEIEFTYEIPFVPTDWSMHLTSRDHDQFVRLDSTWNTGIQPQKQRTIILRPGEVTPLTGIRADVMYGILKEEGGWEKKTELIQGPAVNILATPSKFEYGSPKRLIGQTGRFDFHAAITIRRKDIPDITVVASSAPVPFEIANEKEDVEKPKEDPNKPGLGDSGKKPNENTDMVPDSDNPGGTANKSATADDSKFPLDDVVWSDAGDGLEAGFLLKSSAGPNQGIPLESVVKYQILVRNKLDKPVKFAARLVPNENEDSPFLIPADSINEAIESGKLPQENRAALPGNPVEPRSPAWITQMEFQLGPGESVIIPNQRGVDDLNLFVGTKGTGEYPSIEPIENGRHVLVQPLQIQTTIPSGGVSLLGNPTYTKVDQEGKASLTFATSSLDTPSGTVFYPRIDLEFFVVENDRTESAIDPAKHSINVQGKTLDENGNPIAGARVVLVSTNDDHEPFAETVTDADGSYEFKNAKLPVVQEDSPAEHRKGSFETYAIAPGHGLAWRNDKTVYTFSLKSQPGLPPEPDGTPNFFDSTDKVIELDLHFTKAVTIEGRVVDDQGEPIADAKIRLSKCRRLHPDFADSLADELNSVFQRAVPKAVTHRTTDADGRYRFTDLPSTARLHFVATRDGYAVEHRDAARLEQPELYNIKPMNMDGPVDFEMRPIQLVPIRIVYADTKQPAAKVLISAGGNGTRASVTTDQQGDGMLKLPVGEYDNIVLYPRIGTRYLRTNAANDLTVKLVQADNEQPATQVFEINAASELNVTFVDSKTGEPIPDLKLEVNGSEHGWREWEVERNLSHYRRPKADAKGKLTAMVAPGNLQLGIRNVNLQDSYDFGESILEIECQPGEVKEVLIKVVPVEPELEAGSQSVKLRFMGADNGKPIVGLVVEGIVLRDQSQKFGPFTTNEEGAVIAEIPSGFYRLFLTAEQETGYLPVDKFWENQPRKWTRQLNLQVHESGVEKWLDGKPRDEGNEPPKNPGGTATITYHLLPACELVLRAVDAETGEGIAGVEFYQENLLAEDWSRPIDGQNIGWKKSDDVEAGLTDEDGYFRRLVSANAGYKYHVWKSQRALSEDATVDIVFGQTRAEHVFELSKKVIDAATE